MVRQKSSLFAALTLLLSLTFVLSNTFVIQISSSSDAVAQIRDNDDDDEDEDEDDDDDNILTEGQQVNGNSAGVVIDAAGTLSLKRSTKKSKALWRARQQQAMAKLNPNLAKPSKMRKVSLTRLERLAKESLAETGKLPEDMLYLAGLLKIDYIFAYPETGDVVIAGPAEGFTVDDLGRPRGLKTGRATLELQDLVVAMRAFGPNARPTQKIGVSIDPTQEGLARMQRFLNQIGGTIHPRQQNYIVRGLRKSLGQQVVTFTGIPANTHFAHVLAEADYRMKLIGIGLEVPPVDITTYVEKASPGSVSRNALARWYFVPNYETIRQSKDGLAIQLVGEGVKLVGANEMVQHDGSRVDSNGGDRASKVFTQSFTKLYAQLARRSPVYAQLRNIIDMTITAAAIQQNDFYGQADWQMDLFGDESLFPVEVFEAPKTVATAVSAIWKGRQLMTPVGGGVSIHPLTALDSENLLEDDGTVAASRESVSLEQLPANVWWWD